MEPVGSILLQRTGWHGIRHDGFKISTPAYCYRELLHSPPRFVFTRVSPHPSGLPLMDGVKRCSMISATRRVQVDIIFSAVLEKTVNIRDITYIVMLCHCLKLAKVTFNAAFKMDPCGSWIGNVNFPDDSLDSYFLTHEWRT